MALKKYEVEVDGVKTVLKLDAAEAERLGLAEKARTPQNKQAAAPANKAVPAQKTEAKKRFGRKK